MRAKDTSRTMCRCGDGRLKQNGAEKSAELPVKKRKRGQGKNWTVKKRHTKQGWFDAFQVSFGCFFSRILASESAVSILPITSERRDRV